MDQIFNITSYLYISQAGEINQLVNGFLKFVYFTVVFVLVLAAAYLFSKYISKKGFIKSNNRNIKLIESFSLGVDKNLYLIDVAGEVLLISSTQKDIRLVSQIKSENVILNKVENMDIDDNKKFNDYLNDADSQYTVSDFSDNIGNVKESLKKLKKIVRGNKSNE